eukprot:6172936-Pleurochrysis_carterae.AAC.2
MGECVLLYHAPTCTMRQLYHASTCTLSLNTRPARPRCAFLKSLASPIPQAQSFSLCNARALEDVLKIAPAVRVLPSAAKQSALVPDLVHALKQAQAPRCDPPIKPLYLSCAP